MEGKGVWARGLSTSSSFFGLSKVGGGCYARRAHSLRALKMVLQRGHINSDARLTVARARPGQRWCRNIFGIDLSFVGHAV